MNLRPPGYEPGELTELLHPAPLMKRTYPKPHVSVEPRARHPRVDRTQGRNAPAGVPRSAASAGVCRKLWCCADRGFLLQQTAR